MTANLKPCPFCGGKATTCRSLDESETYYFVQCTGCGVGSPCKPTLVEAEIAWNHRAYLDEYSELPADDPYPDDPAWAPACQAASEFEEAMYVLENYADVNKALEAANEALDILKAHKPQIEQLHAKLGAVETKERKQ